MVYPCPQADYIILSQLQASCQFFQCNAWHFNYQSGSTDFLSPIGWPYILFIKNNNFEAVMTGMLSKSEGKTCCPKVYWGQLRPGGWINIKMSSYQYRKSHCGDKTILRPSYLHNGISYTGKMTSLYWFSPLNTASYQNIGLHLFNNSHTCPTVHISHPSYQSTCVAWHMECCMDGWVITYFSNIMLKNKNKNKTKTKYGLSCSKKHDDW